MIVVRKRLESHINVILLPAFEEKLYFHAVRLLSRDAGKKTLDIFESGVDSTLAGMVIAIVQNVWDVQTNCCSLGVLWVVIHPYLCISLVVLYFQEL